MTVVPPAANILAKKSSQNCRLRNASFAVH
jgi:hypothetical protein